MDVKCLMPLGLIVVIVFLMGVSARLSSLSENRRQARQAWLNNSMKNSHMVQPATVFEPGNMVVEERIPVPVENSTADFVSAWNASKKRQRDHAQKMAIKRAHERSAQEGKRRAEVDAVIKKAYASLGKDEEWKKL